DGRTQFLVTNPIDRYLINAPMLPDLKKNPDGSLTIYIQKHSPGKDKESNWLPAPDGPIFIVMRLYWPKIEPPSILPLGHGTWKPPAIVNVDTLRALDKPRFGDKSLETLVRTDDRYGGDGPFHGPRGWGYWNHLEYPRPIQDPNLWPDTQSTYFVGQLELPAGATLTLHGAYPRARYFQLALYRFENNTFVSVGGVSGPDMSRTRARPIRFALAPIGKPRRAASPPTSSRPIRRATRRSARRTRSTPERRAASCRRCCASTSPTFSSMGPAGGRRTHRRSD